MESESRIVQKRGYKFKRPGLSLHKSAAAATVVDDDTVKITREIRPPSKLPKNGTMQTSITSFTKNPKPVATVLPHRSPTKEAPAFSWTSKRKRDVVPTPTSATFVPSKQEEADTEWDDFEMPVITHVSPRMPKKTGDAKQSDRRWSGASANHSPNLDNSSFTDSIMEDLFKNDSEDDDVQQVIKRSRKTRIIASDSDEDENHIASISTSKTTRNRKSWEIPHTITRPAQSSHEKSQVPKVNIPIDSPSIQESVPCGSSTDVENYEGLLNVMDEICEIISRVSSADLMNFVAKDYDRLQKLLFRRKQIKDKAGERNQKLSVRGAKNSPRPAGRLSDLPTTPGIRNSTVRTPEVSHSMMKTPHLITSTAIKKTSATKLQIGTESPIPCGDSFFDDDVELTQPKMSYMNRFQKAPSSCKTSPSLSASSSNLGNSRGLALFVPQKTSLVNTVDGPADGWSQFDDSDALFLDNAGDHLDNGSTRAMNYSFDYGLQTDPGSSKSKPGPKPVDMSTVSVAPSSPGNCSMDGDVDGFDDEFDMDEFGDIEDVLCAMQKGAVSSPSPRPSNSRTPTRTGSCHTLDTSSHAIDTSGSYQPMFAGSDKDDGASGMFDGHEFPHSSELQKVFRSVFGLREFRHNQLQAINASLLGLDTFILMPTGGGKSLCYQLPALVTNGVSLVISPLRALIQDQVQRLISLDVPAAHLSSDVNQTQAQNVYCQLSQRDPGIKLLYVTPEKLSASAKLLDSLRHLYDRQLLDRFIIDEAHCVSQWGHDFRPDYKKLSMLRERYPGVPMMALTATATPRVRKDILHQLSMKDPKWFMQSFNRPNLKYSIFNKKPKSTTPDVIKFIKDKYPRDYGIVYCLSRNECDTVAKDLRQSGIQAVAYHAGLSDTDRTSVQERWLYGDRCKVICATIAFGMGIDKPDVRFVIHYSLPKSVEGYYQEAGRAGRDGILAHCVLFYNYQDVKRLRRMMEMDKSATYATRRVHLDNLYCMVQYAENVADCRRAQVLQYFGEHHFDRDRCHDVRGAICDNCASKGKFQLRDVTSDVQAIVKGVGEITSGRRDFTMLHIIEIFKGSENIKIKENGHDRISLHGRGKAYSRPDSERLFRKLVIDRILAEELRITAQDHAVCYLRTGPKSAELLQGKIKVELQVQGKGSRAEVAKIGEETQSDDEKLLDECYKDLLAMAKTIAREHNIKNFASVFTNDMLWQLAKHRPVTLEDLRRRRIDGLTEYRISAYGVERFLDITTSYVCRFATLNDERRCSSHKEDAGAGDAEDAGDDWTSRYFEESYASPSRGRGGKRGWRGKKSFRGKRGKKSSSRGRGRGRGGTKNSSSSFSDYTYKKSTGARAAPPDRPTSMGRGSLGMMPVPQPRSFLSSNMFLIKKN